MNGQKKIMYKIIALFGEAGTGKDSIQNYLCQTYHFNPIISYTTRPPRQGEIEGISYHFITDEEFLNKTLNGDMLEATSFNGWFYGTALSTLKEDIINIGVFNIEGIKILVENSQLEILPIKIETEDRLRITRQLYRENNPNCLEICRRFLADTKDFNNFKNNESLGYIVYQNNTRNMDFHNIEKLPDFISFINKDNIKK